MAIQPFMEWIPIKKSKQLYINNLRDDVFCDNAIYADDTTLYSKCDQASDLWQQLELASEVESDLSLELTDTY